MAPFCIISLIGTEFTGVENKTALKCAKNHITQFDLGLLKMWAVLASVLWATLYTVRLLDSFPIKK